MNEWMVGSQQITSKPRRAIRRKPAILGGQAAFTDTLHVGRPNMPNRALFLDRMAAVFDSGRMTNLGPMVCEFERRIAELTGYAHCVATCNATTALELAVHALGMHGEVIVPSFTFIADAHALLRQGIRPVFCDVDPDSHCLDPAHVEAAITDRTSGILAVHLWGNRSATSALADIARRHKLSLLFDAAHALGRRCAVTVAGRGDAEVYSFHATKIVHAFEGGAIVTDDTELAERLAFMTNFGFTAEDEVNYLGTNGKMSEASAVMGLCSLETFDSIVTHNLQNFRAYAAGLATVPGVWLHYPDDGSQHNYHYVVAEIDEALAGLSRDELVAVLRLENVVARRYFFPGCHRMEPYASCLETRKAVLPTTETVARRVFVLPTGLSVSNDDAYRLAACIAELVANAKSVRRALAACTDSRLPSYAIRC